MTVAYVFYNLGSYKTLCCPALIIVPGVHVLLHACIVENSIANVEWMVIIILFCCYFML